jgi:hypothetical protein
MRLTLVERQESRIRCVPDLGVAYLLGICKREGIDVSLVPGSPRTLYDSLVGGVAGTFDLFCKNELYSKVIKDRGEQWFKDFLKFNYGIATSNNIADKTNPEAMAELWELTGFLKNEVWPRAQFKENLLDEVRKTRPDVVGFSFWNFYDHMGIYGVIKDVISELKSSDLPILIGGPGTITARTRRDIFKVFNPDFVIHHEGELALVRLLRMLESGSVKSAPNISFRDGGIVEGESRPIEDLDSLAIPDFSLYDLDSFFPPVRILPMMSARGCEYGQCAFCNHHATYTGYREFSTETVLRTIDEFKEKYKTSLIMFHDETMTARRAGVLTSAFSNLDNTYLYSYAYPKDYTKELLGGMYKVGFRVLVWGVESGCQRVLDLMRKGTDVQEVERIIRDAHSVGVSNVAFILFGFPGETKKEALETVDFLEHNSQYIERHASTVFRFEEEAPIGKNPGAWGAVDLGKGKYRVKKGMQREEVLEFLKSLDKRRVKTSADTKYYMPGDTEFRAYFLVQAVYGETANPDLSDTSLVPVRNGILKDDRILPSLLMDNVSRPVVPLDAGSKRAYGFCDGTRSLKDFDAGSVDAISRLSEFPYIVFFKKKFL